MQCSHCESLLMDYDSGALGPLERESVSRHLDQCDDCASQLAQLFEVQLMASRWQDERIPAFHPRRYLPFEPGGFAGTTGFSNWGPLLATLPSVVAVVLALVLVLSRMELPVNTDGYAVAADVSDVDYVSGEQLDQRLEDFEIIQNERLSQAVYQLRSRQIQQIESSQLLLRTLLEVNRQERYQDMDKLMVAWVQAQEQQSVSTEQDLRYLLAKQREDDLRLRQLSSAIRQVGNKQ